MRFGRMLFSILVFVHTAQARISPAEPNECNHELTLPKFHISVVNEAEPEKTKIEVEAQLQRLFTRFVGLGFRVPPELNVYIENKNENMMSWTVFTQGFDTLHLGPHPPMRAHQVAHVVLNHTLWHDSLLKVMVDLRLRVDILDQQDDALLAEMAGLSKNDERYRAIEGERMKLQSLYRNETQRVFEDKKYLGALIETFVDIAAYADTGMTQIRSDSKEEVFGKYGDDVGTDMWNARDFAADIDPEKWRETNYHRRPQIFFGPVRSYIGKCLKNATQDQRFAYLAIYYQAMREAMNEKIDIYGNQLDSWAGPVVEENKKLISLLQKYGSCS